MKKLSTIFLLVLCLLIPVLAFGQGGPMTSNPLDRIQRAGARVQTNSDGSVTIYLPAGRTLKLPPQASLPNTCIDGDISNVAAVGLYQCVGSAWQRIAVSGGVLVLAYTKATLPAPGVSGRLARVTDNERGLWYDTGTTWRQLGDEVNLKDFGAVGNGIANDSPALQNALNALAALGSATAVLKVPGGTYQLSTPVSRTFNNLTSVVRIEGIGSKAIFRFASGTGTTNLSLSGAQSLTLSRLNFVGTTGVSTDAATALYIASNVKTNLYDVNFFGVASAETGGSVLRIVNTNLVTRNLNFWGCTGNFYTGVSIMVVDTWRAISMDDTDFIDYGTLNGTTYSKTGTPGEAWLEIGTPAQENEGIAKISGMYSDEGAAYSIIANATGNSAQIEIDGITSNTNPTDLGQAINITGFKYAKVSNSKFKTLGVNPNPRSIVSFNGVERAEVDGVRGLVSAQVVSADATTTSLRVRNSRFDSLISSAGYTRVEDSTVTTYNVPGAVEVSEGGRRTFGRSTLSDTHSTEFYGGGVRVAGLSVPGDLGVNNNSQGFPGEGATWTYYVHAVDAQGRRTLAESVTTNNGWATLTSDTGGGQWHMVTWLRVPGAVDYIVTRNSPTARIPKPVEYIAFTNYAFIIDGGIATEPFTPPTSNETSLLTVDGQVVANTFKLNTAKWTEGAGAPSGACAAGSIYSQTGGGTGTSIYLCDAGSWVTVSTGSGASEPYLVYTALLTQSGTGAPVATVLRNTLGGTVIWNRMSNGKYTATLEGAFTVNKTMGIAGVSLPTENQASFSSIVANVSANSVELRTQFQDAGATASDYVDNLLSNTAIEIRVYP